MNNSKQDGGYYAIKGFEYQIDKTIIEILSASNENEAICIEQIQDLNANNYVMQIKYKETQKFTNSKIKEPIISLIKEFLADCETDTSKVYYLYCYFLSQPEGVKNVDLTYLNRILGNRNSLFTEKEKKDFLKDFILIFSPDFQSQFSQALTKIKDVFCSSAKSEEAILYYANIANLLRKKVVANNDPKKRTCTKQEMVSLIKDGKKVIFDSAFREFKGDQAYFKNIREKLLFRNIDDYERFFIVQTTGRELIADIKEVVLKIKNKFYIKNNRALKSGAPYIYLSNVSAEKLKTLKSQLFAEGYIIRDGHDFFNADFNINSLKEVSTTQNNICLKFVNEEGILHSVINEPLGKTKEIYQLYISSLIDIQSDAKNISIQIKALSDITNIF